MANSKTVDPHAVAEVNIELFDARTGRKVDESRSENYVTPVGIAYHRWMIRNSFATTNPTTQGLAADPAPPNPFNTIYLSDSVTPIDTASSSPRGSIVGYATKAVYAGIDTKLGSPNYGAFEADPSHTKWVFDWPTNAANGTIGSAGWEYNTYPSGHGMLKMTDLTTFDYRYAYMLTPAGKVWNAVAQNLFNYETGVVGMAWGPSYTQMGLPAVPTDACHDGVDVYVCAGGSLIRKFPMPSGAGAVTASTLAVSGLTNIVGLTYDGTNLRVLDATTKQIYSVDKVTGAVNSQFAHPFTESVSRLEFDFDGGRIMASGRNLAVSTLPSIFWYLTGGTLDAVSSIYGYSYYQEYYGPMVKKTGTNDAWFATFTGNSSAYFLNKFFTGVGTRVLLPTPIVKDNTQTMKLTYTMTYA